RLRPRPGERILDAGCDTGANLRAIERTGSRAKGVDFSLGMLGVARRRLPASRLMQADLNQKLPLGRQAFDAYLCSLVS
ncbi:MAG: methyltransferase domain-containing protein, partial [bacterium]|nr:methyltransferase domain-containing protein [bacterium]